MQRNGELKLYWNGRTIWNAGIEGGACPWSLTMQSDGNLVVYDANRDVRWASGSHRDIRFDPYILKLQNDGNLFIDDREHDTIWSTHTWTGGARIANGRELVGGCDGSSQSIYSDNGRFEARMQSDGNFVVYDEGIALWASNTVRDGTWCPYRIVMQDDGNLVLYDSEGEGDVLWSSGTHKADRKSPYRLVMQDDGNLVLYDAADDSQWASGTMWDPAILGNGRMLVGGCDGSSEEIISGDRKYKAVMQSDANFVVYKDGNALWASGTVRDGTWCPYKIVMQGDGNLVLYDSEGAGDVLWSSGTHRTNPYDPYRLVMQGDGNLVLYDREDDAIWATGTN